MRAADEEYLYTSHHRGGGALSLKAATGKVQDTSLRGERAGDSHTTPPPKESVA